MFGTKTAFYYDRLHYDKFDAYSRYWLSIKAAEVHPPSPPHTPEMDHSAQAYFSQDGHINHWLSSSSLILSQVREVEVQHAESHLCLLWSGCYPLYPLKVVLRTKFWVLPNARVMWRTPKEVFSSNSSAWLVARDAFLKCKRSGRCWSIFINNKCGLVQPSWIT